MKTLRLVLTVLAIAAAGFLAFRGFRGKVPPLPPAATDDPSKPAPWNPLQEDPKAPPASGNAADTPSPLPPPEPEPPPPGTAVRADSEVSIVVPYRTGTKSRYLVTEAYLAKERQDAGPEPVQWSQHIWMVSTEVVAGDGSGAARIRLLVESFRLRTEAQGRRIEFDSLHPDETLLAEKGLALDRGLKPVLATLGMPLEFSLDATGAITDIEGVEGMNRKFVEVVGSLDPKYREDVTDAPTVENLTERWGEILFPRLGGGALKAAAPRDLTLRTTFLERWSNVVTGKLRATHDDPEAFRVEFKGKHTVEELNRPATSPMAVGVEKTFLVSDAEAYVASWRFDRTHGRLAASQFHTKFQMWISQRAGPGANGTQQFEPHFVDVERRTAVELLDD